MNDIHQLHNITVPSDNAAAAVRRSSVICMSQPHRSPLIPPNSFSAIRLKYIKSMTVKTADTAADTGETQATANIEIMMAAADVAPTAFMFAALINV